MKGVTVTVGTLWCWSCSFVWGLCWKRASKAAFSKVMAGVHLIRSVVVTISFHGRINGFHAPFLWVVNALFLCVWGVYLRWLDPAKVPLWLQEKKWSDSRNPCLVMLENWTCFYLRGLKTLILTPRRSQAHNPLLIPALFVLKFTYLPDFSL